MSRDSIDIQAAFDGLAKSIHDLTQAFEAVSGFLLATMESLSNSDFESLAESLDRMASACSRQSSAISGEHVEPNQHLLGLAEAMRGVAKRGAPAFGVIDGGKD